MDRLKKLSKRRRNVNFSKVLTEFEAQSQSPPGKDPCISACYKAVVSLYDKDKDMRKLMEDLYVKRDLSSKHFVNLFFKALQYIQLQEFQNTAYPELYNDQSAWTADIKKILRRKKRVLKDIMLKRDTGTTKYQRYMGPKFIIRKYFGNSVINVLDVGCGGNYGLGGYLTNEPFQEIEDLTGEVKNVVSKKLSVGKVLGVDKFNPYDKQTKEWRLACSFYPKELKNKKEVVRFESKIEQLNVPFTKIDLTKKLSRLNKGTFDVAVMSTMLYMLNNKKRRQIINNIKKILSPKGIIIIQDFARKDKHKDLGINFDINWFKKNYTYRTFLTGQRYNWEILEVLRWKDGRCASVKKGSDFDYFKEDIKDVKNKNFKKYRRRSFLFLRGGEYR